MTAYHYIGLALAVLSGGCLTAFFYSLSLQAQEKKRPLYRRKLPKTNYPDSFPETVRLAYEVTGDIREMLQLLESSWDGKIQRRIMAARDYLEHSRYRDYETALYHYLSDGSEECEQIIGQVLEQEIRKRNGLICRNQN